MNLTGQKVYQKTPKPTAAQKRAAKAWIRGVRGLACIFCGKGPPSTPHHCIYQRYSQRRPPDDQTIPACNSCHAALHANKRLFFEIHGPDIDYLAKTADMLKGELND